jgi:predicted Zn-dependent protease with MMP-like domain
MTDDEFRKHVDEGVKALPPWVQEELQNVLFLVEDESRGVETTESEPGEQEVLFGLYEGVPRSERGNESILLPDIITIFKNPILETYTAEHDIVACIHNTVWHEVAHYFGHGEEWVEEEEIRRGKTT